MGKTPADWDRAYAEAAPFGDAPCLGLLQCLARPDVAPRTALMLADGDGRNGSWLAQRGVAVTAVDYAPTATRLGQQRDRASGVAVDRITADLEVWEPGGAQFDLVAILFLQVPEALRQRVLELALAATAPGGHLLIETFAGAVTGVASHSPPPPVRWSLQQTLDHASRSTPPPQVLEAFEGQVFLQDGLRHTGLRQVMRLLLRVAP
ncbi:MAG: class I SAM-dependent methyltransferase [Pseudomonadota bacterium]